MPTATERSEERLTERGRPWLVAALLAIQALLAFGSIGADSRTFDETSHFISGVTYWSKNDFRFDPENPPLVNLWATLPLRFATPPDLPFGSADWKMGNQWGFADEWFARGEAAERWLLPARAMMTLLLLALSLTVYGAARDAIGEPGALVSMACICFWPTLIAHGRLVTSDIPLGLFATLAVWTAYRAFVRPCSLRWLFAALALAGLVLTKFSAVLVIPAWIVAAVLGYGRSGSRRWHLALLSAASLAAFAYASIWAMYGFRYSMYANDVADISTIADPNDARFAQRVYWQQILNYTAQERNLVLMPLVVSICESRRLLPEAYLYGFSYMYHSAQGRATYALGMYGDRGWWWYFPLAFVLKTPIGILVLLAIGAGAIATTWKRALRDWRLAAALGVFALVYALAAMRGNINIGERHFAPIYPIVAIACGATATAMRGAGRWLALGLIGTSAASTVEAFPNFLAYFNEPTRLAFRNSVLPPLIDSNVDWGQDLRRVGAALKERGAGAAYLAYFGSADPRPVVTANLLLSFVPRTPLGRVGPGIYFVSPSVLSGTYHAELHPGYWADAERVARLRALAAGRAGLEGAALDEALNEARMTLLLGRLRAIRPDRRVGALRVYELDAAEVEALASLEGPYP